MAIDKSVGTLVETFFTSCSCHTRREVLFFIDTEEYIQTRTSKKCLGLYIGKKTNTALSTELTKKSVNVTRT